MRDADRRLHLALERQRSEERGRGAELPPGEERADLQLRVAALIELADQFQDHRLAEHDRGVALLGVEPAHRRAPGKRVQWRVRAVESLAAKHARARPDLAALADDLEDGPARLLVERILERIVGIAPQREQ